MHACMHACHILTVPFCTGFCFLMHFTSPWLTTEIQRNVYVWLYVIFVCGCMLSLYVVVCYLCMWLYVIFVCMYTASSMMYNCQLLYISLVKCCICVYACACWWMHVLQILILPSVCLFFIKIFVYICLHTCIYMHIHTQTLSSLSNMCFSYIYIYIYIYI